MVSLYEPHHHLVNKLGFPISTVQKAMPGRFPRLPAVYTSVAWLSILFLHLHSTTLGDLGQVEQALSLLKRHGGAEGAAPAGGLGVDPHSSFFFPLSLTKGEGDREPVLSEAEGG
ncbi:MAG: hypothetical protein HY684_04180 [Chloroflexi bacterium]|nr:hypothetical protein [Chloroflexota bacterium]